MIKFNQNTWLKLFIDINTDLRKKSKDDFEKLFCKFMNNTHFVKTIEKVRKNRNIELVITVSEPNYHTTKFFREHLLVIERKKT